MCKKMKIWCIIYIFLAPAHALPSDNCADWFNSTHIDRNAKDCVIQCGLIKKDMTNFMCDPECADLCHPKKVICRQDPVWNEKIKSGRLPKWDIEFEKDAPWTNIEKEKLLLALNALPTYFKKIKIDGFYRLKKSIQLGNPASTDGKSSILLYDLFFEEKVPLVKILSHEISHILYFKIDTKLKYEYLKVAEWTDTLSTLDKNSGFQTERTSFVEADGKDSPEEDFANNIEYFLAEPNTLKDKNPKIFQWIKQRFGDNFSLNKDCL